jgi:cysteine desulfurase
MDSLYLDHNASAPLRREAYEAMRPWLEKRQANASSLHKAGQAARAAIESVRDGAAKALGAWPEEIFFTSGATEACNLALLAAVEDGRWALCFSQAEHPAVLQTAAALAAKGCAVKALRVTPQGSVDLEHLRAELKASPGAVLACMHANNETGSLNPIEEIARSAHQGGGLFFCDITQSLAKTPLDLHALDIDLAAASAHKFGGPQGVGILFKRRSLRLAARLFGGGQEQGLRPGTENLPGIVGMGAALEAGLSGLATQARAWSEAREHLALGLKRLWPQALIHGGDAVLANTLSVSFLGLEKDTLLMKLDQMGLQASAGSACAAGASQPSHVLEAMGVGPAAMNSVIRFSFGAAQGPQEAAEALKRIGQALADLRSAGLIPA